MAVHTFSMLDIQGDFLGNLASNDPTIICDNPGGEDPPGCNLDPDGLNLIYTDKLTGATMYPIDSQFGFYVSDYVGAAQKVRDEEYLEGWVGEFAAGEGENPDLPGIVISNVDTDVLKTLPGMGGWCQGVGGEYVKCETEHYSTMEHALSCNETIRYEVLNLDPALVNPATEQAWLLDPFTGLPLTDPVSGLDCSDYALDDNLYYVVDGEETVSALLPEGSVDCDLAPEDRVGIDQAPCLAANESTVLNDIAVGAAYGMTKKDDGKPLYRMGTAVKRPNDVRVSAPIDLPQEWLDNPNTVFEVVKALLTVRHTITNNPNDQIRPEDYENEAATGRKPSYVLAPNLDGAPDLDWETFYSCYENDAHFLPAGTKLKNTADAYETCTPLPDQSECSDGRPYPFSSDLREGLSAGFYQTIDREPFEWSYLTPGTDGDFLTSEEASDILGIAQTDPTYHYTMHEPIPDVELDVGGLFEGYTLVSGPRWRLTPTKFGQDIPGLEIPNSGCLLPPPFTSDLLKYNVSEPTVTTLNLLDWKGGEANSPLKFSTGWTKPQLNENWNGEPCTVFGDVETCISVNGLPLTSDKFDLAFYIKGDKKGVQLYDATLELVYLGGGVTPVGGDRIGTFRPSDTTFRLDLDGDGVFDAINDLVYGPMGTGTSWPVAGDWNGDGVDTIGYFDGTRFHLDTDGDGIAETSFFFGTDGDLPVAGDWNGDSVDEIGVWRPSVAKFYLDANANRVWDGPSVDWRSGTYGLPTDYPIAGNWDGVAGDEIGIYRPSAGGEARFILDDGNLGFAIPPDVRVDAPENAGGYPVIGDWNDNGTDDLGYITSGGEFHLGTNVGGDFVELETNAFGSAGDKPVAGSWD